MIIEHRPCPRCQVPNTARFSDGVAVCFNCQASWNPQDPEGTLVPPGAGSRPRELAEGAQVGKRRLPASRRRTPFSALELAPAVYWTPCGRVLQR